MGRHDTRSICFLSLPQNSLIFVMDKLPIYKAPHLILLWNQIIIMLSLEDRWHEKDLVKTDESRIKGVFGLKPHAPNCDSLSIMPVCSLGIKIMNQPTNCLSVFDHFAGLALKGLIAPFVLFFLVGNVYEVVDKETLVFEISEVPPEI